MMKTLKKTILFVLLTVSALIVTFAFTASAASSSSAVIGDADCNGVVNINDAIAVARMSVGTSSLTALGLKNADVNGDKTVDMKDALLIARRSSKVIAKFPIEKTNELPPDEF